MGKKRAGSAYNEVLNRASRLTMGIGQSQVVDSNIDQKVMAVGGHFDPQNNEYSQYSEIFDLSIDKWTRNAKITIQRLQPFMIPIGVEKALLIGGFKRKNRKFEEILVK